MKTTLIIAALMLGGCASDAQYKAYADAQSAAAQADASVLIAIANKSSEGAVAAAFAQAKGGASQSSALRAPESAGDVIYKFVAAVAGPAAQIYGIIANKELGLRQSDNGALIARSTNDTMTGIAKQIQAPITITNTDRHDVITPAPVISPPVVITPPAPVIITPPAPVIITPIVSGK